MCVVVCMFYVVFGEIVDWCYFVVGVGCWDCEDW